MNEKNKRKNKSSIVRVIISNFDSKEMKEFKVLYTKQGGVDTFLTSTSCEATNNEIGRLIFHSIKEKARDKKLYSVIIKQDPLEPNIVYIKKIDKIRNHPIREYKIIGTYTSTNSGGKKIILKIEDLNSAMVSDPRKIRKISSETERVLLSEVLTKRYSNIANRSIDEIDSKAIYKIKRFLNYRSNMIIYLNFINDFLTKNTGITEIYELENEIDTSDKIDIIVNNIKKYISDGITNYNHRNKKLREKEKDKTKIYEDISFISDEELKSDIKKILKIYSDFRHKLVHYNYDFFDKLFNNEKINNLDSELGELLNLKIFNIISILKKERATNKTNYLTNESKIILLGKIRGAKTAYEIYGSLCARKNGFNAFINNFFTKDGVEDDTFKEIIRKNFDEELKNKQNDEIAKSKKQTKENQFNNFLNQVETFRKENEDIYYWDINDSPTYKKLYSQRKNLITLYNKQINGIKDKNFLKNLNKKLTDIKEKMEKITKTNSLIRLRYKLQIAYGFLMSEFQGDIEKFKNEFDSSKTELIQKYHEKMEDYLNYSISKELENSFNMMNLKNLVDKIYLDTPEIINEQNVSMKFYILIYILLPIEIRGDFLGFIKKYYYDIKNIDFIDENLKENDFKEIIEKETFFHDIRLFEKNIKHYQLINYDISNFYNLNEKMGNYLESLGITNWEKQVFRNQSDQNIFGKNIILPIFKFYQNIFKLLNDIEIFALFSYMEKRNFTSLDETICDITGGKNLNYTNTIKKAFSGNNEALKKVSSDFQIRNDIAHFNYVNTLENILFEKEIKFNSEKNESSNTNSDEKINEKIKKYQEAIKNNLINERVDFIIDHNKVKKLMINIDLGFNFINDYYMRKEKFIFNQRGLEKEYIISPQQKERKKQENEILDKYKINIERPQSLNKLYNYSKDLLEQNYIKNKELLRIIEPLTIHINKNLSCTLKQAFSLYPDKAESFTYKEGSQLLGIYKKIMVQKIKQSLVKKFTQNELKYINVVVTDSNSTEKKKNKTFTIVLKRQGNEEKFEIIKNFLVPEIKEINISTNDNQRFFLENTETKEELKTVVDFSKSFIEKEIDKKMFVPGKYIYKVNYKI